MGKRGKTKWKQGSVNHVLDISTPRKTTTNWADEVENEMDDSFDSKPFEKVVLPTAPRSSCAQPFDESKVPHTGPFQVHVSNIPYDISDDELRDLFSDLNIKDVRLPRDDKGTNRVKGYGYVVFHDRASLISALQKGEALLKTRTVRIDLATNDIGRGGRGRGGQRGDMGSMRPDGSSTDTFGNWRARSGPTEEMDDHRGFERRRDYGSSSGGGGGGGFSRGDSYEKFGRDDRYHREDRPPGPRDDRYERGGGGGFGRDRDERFGRERDMGFKDRGGNRDDDSYGRRDDRGGFGRSDRDGEKRFGPRRDDTRNDIPQGGDAGEKTRKKLNLKPRSADLPPPASSDPPPAPAAAASAQSIFGNAKPVDTSARFREIEERLANEDRGGTGARAEASNEKSWSSSNVSTERSSNFLRSESQTSSVSSASHTSDRKPDALPPKENAWNKQRNMQPSSHVNNGRTSPSDEVASETQSIDRKPAGDDERSAPRGDVKRAEPSRRPDDKTGSGGVVGVSSSGRGGMSGGGGPPRAGTESRQPRTGPPAGAQPKHREPRKDDDASKMPKLPESQPPNFAGLNKFSSLGESEDASGE